MYDFNLSIFRLDLAVDLDWSINFFLCDFLLNCLCDLCGVLILLILLNFRSRFYVSSGGFNSRLNSLSPGLYFRLVFLTKGRPDLFFQELDILNQCLSSF